MTVLLEAHGIEMTYRGGDGGMLQVLSGVELSIQPGEFIAIVGASGSGKSTLLHLLGALDRPTAGSIQLEGTVYADLAPVALAELRNRRIGFVFQFHHLLREFTALENVALPLRIGGWSTSHAMQRAADLLAQVGLTDRATHRPPALSGGEQQRVAVARALAVSPALVLADEPSGNLDLANSVRLHDLLGSVVRAAERAVVVVTHSRALAARADRVLALKDGVLENADLGEIVV